MSAPKSDTATIEARKNRLLELLAEGKSQVEAAEVLRIEGYPADVRTLRRDVTSLRGQWGKENMTQFEVWRNEHIAELEDLRKKLEDNLIGPAETIALALAIIREDSKIKGTAAPTKSESLTINADVQVMDIDRQLRHVQAFAGLYEDEELEELDRVAARKRTCRVTLDAKPFHKQLEDSCGS